MSGTDSRQSDCQADARGIMHCLRMLAEEAASLRLERTCEALRQALETCAAENGFAPILDEIEIVEGGERPAVPRPPLH